MKELKIEASDNEIFNEPAKQTIKNTSFSPGMKGGKAVDAWVSIPVKYKLSEK